LPSEPELAERFGVSRIVVREAVRLLAAKGLVVVRHGSGVWVRPVEQWDSLDPVVLVHRLRAGQAEDLIDHLLEARRVVEIEVVRFAALRRTEDELGSLHDIVDTMKEAVDDDTRSMLDVQFHDGLFRAAHNPVLQNMAHAALNVLRIARPILRLDVVRRGVSQRGHELILAAVARRDDAGARAAMLAHIEQAEADLRRSLRLLATAHRSTEVG
jgi:GntR family transcriptional regulator, transcriptional repressor for pyruvate dehydrogenase complex